MCINPSIQTEYSVQYAIIHDLSLPASISPRLNEITIRCRGNYRTCYSIRVVSFFILRQELLQRPDMEGSTAFAVCARQGSGPS